MKVKIRMTTRLMVNCPASNDKEVLLINCEDCRHYKGTNAKAMELNCAHPKSEAEGN